MKLDNRISPAIIEAAAGMLQPYCPELSPQSLLAAIREYGSFEKAIAPNPPKRLLTRKEAALLLGISLPTLNRMCNAGTLRRIYVTKGTVKIDPASVDAILNSGCQEA